MTDQAITSSWHASARQVTVPPPTMATVREPSSRYSDRSMSIGTRLFGVGGALAVILLILVGSLLTWRTYAVPPVTATVSVFDVVSPAAPPEPVREFPSEPQKMRHDKSQPDPDMPRIKPPEIELPRIPSVSAVVRERTPAPDPPIRETTVPENKPAPPAPQISTGKPTWEGLVLGALNKAKCYPRDAHFARQQGVPYIRFVMNRDGKVMSVRIERSSGFRSLDQEALALPKRAQPLPRPPEDVNGETIELVVPVEFFVR